MGSQGERAPSEPVPGLVTLHLWRVPARRVPSAPLRLAIGIGESPMALRGTFSLWEAAQALHAFAYAGPHAEAIRRTTLEQWYAEELLARFAVLRSPGTIGGKDPLG